MFTLPPSPFEEEKQALGYGFMARIPLRARSKPARLTPAKAGTPRPHLTDDQKDYIGSTGAEVPASVLAERFSIGIGYVYKLRDQYRYPDSPRNKRDSVAKPA